MEVNRGVPSFREWSKTREGRGSRTFEKSVEQKGGARANALFVALTRAKFGYGLAPAGVTAAIRRLTSGRFASPRRGGARLYGSTGMPREVNQELVGWRSSGIIEKVYEMARS